jgi:hypothetical protein
MKISSHNPYWTQHIDAWQASGLNQNAYCREYDLKPHQFSYWKRKLAALDSDQKPKASTPSSAFIPLTVNETRSSTSGLRLRLPNGCEFLGIEVQHLSTVTQLFKVLK